MKNILVLLFAFVCLSSCKDEIKETPFEITGHWVSTSNDCTPNGDFDIVFYDNNMFFQSTYSTYVIYENVIVGTPEESNYQLPVFTISILESVGDYMTLKFPNGCTAEYERN